MDIYINALLEFHEKSHRKLPAIDANTSLKDKWKGQRCAQLKNNYGKL
ncbi:MAG: hypothetical protein FWF73_01605 [Spirochaetes bacterium]|nr:hypothetical protein [Spirochaetota bacterium]